MDKWVVSGWKDGWMMDGLMGGPGGEQIEEWVGG